MKRTLAAVFFCLLLATPAWAAEIITSREMSEACRHVEHYRNVRLKVLNTAARVDTGLREVDPRLGHETPSRTSKTAQRAFMHAKQLLVWARLYQVLDCKAFLKEGK